VIQNLSEKSKVKSGRQAKKLSQVSPKLKIFIVIGIIAIIATGGFIGFLVYGYITSQAQAPAPTPTTATFIVNAWPDEELVSANVPLEIYTPDPYIIFLYSLFFVKEWFHDQINR